jgi:hypothetical protein
MVIADELDKDIELTHSYENRMCAHWYSGTKQVSDLYVYKQYKIALARIAELEMLINPPIVFDEIEQRLFLEGTR